MNLNKRCYNLVSQIPRGKISTYKQIAKTLKNKTYRSRGTARAKNPRPILVPCHRIIKSNGFISGMTNNYF